MSASYSERMRMRTLFIVAAVAVAVPVAIAANGGRGGLDPTFGAKGLVKGLVDVRVGNQSGAQDALAQPDSKVVLAGFAADSNPDTTSSDFLAIRLNRNGSLDQSFGAKGIVRTPIDPGGGKPRSADAIALALGPDGSIVLAGPASYGSGSTFARYTPTGKLDTSFSGDGILTLDPALNVTVTDVAVQPDGKVVAVGTADSGSSFMVMRLLSNGALDGSFGAGGIVKTNFGAPAVGARAAAVVVLGDGTIVVAGTRDSKGPEYADVVVARYLPNGQGDPSFGSGGIVVTPGPQAETATALAVAPDGKIVVAGTEGPPDLCPYPSSGVPYRSSGLPCPPPDVSNFHLVRYLPSGMLDRTFGGVGVVTTSVTKYAVLHSVAVEPDGTILAAGIAQPDSVTYQDYTKFAVTAYQDDGTLDKTFGIGGTRTYDVGGNSSRMGLAIQKAAARSGADRLVLAGDAGSPGIPEHVAAIGVDLGLPPPARCRVPRVVGLTLSRARARISSSHCMVGHVRKAKSIRRRGTVISQSPRAGRYLSSRGRVSLVVSLGR
jgi:uncharacterized delta-60 repeat protein